MKNKMATEEYIPCFFCSNIYNQKSYSIIKSKWYRVKPSNKMMERIKVNKNCRINAYKAE